MSHYRIKRKAVSLELAKKVIADEYRKQLLALRDQALREKSLPSGADLDAVAEEERIREATE